MRHQFDQRAAAQVFPDQEIGLQHDALIGQRGGTAGVAVVGVDARMRAHRHLTLGLTFASVGPGSLYHLLGEHMSKVTGIPMTHVPYKGGAPALQDLLATQVDIFMTPYGKGQIQMVEEGKLKAPAVLSAERQELFKRVPTLNESKALKGFVFETWAGFFVRKDTPEPLVQVLHKALSEVANDPTVRSALEAQAMIVPPPQPLSALGKLYADNTARYQAIAKSMNLQPQ